VTEGLKSPGGCFLETSEQWAPGGEQPSQLQPTRIERGLLGEDHSFANEAQHSPTSRQCH